MKINEIPNFSLVRLSDSYLEPGEKWSSVFLVSRDGMAQVVTCLGSRDVPPNLRNVRITDPKGGDVYTFLDQDEIAAFFQGAGVMTIFAGELEENQEFSYVEENLQISEQKYVVRKFEIGSSSKFVAQNIQTGVISELDFREKVQVYPSKPK